MKLKTVQVQFEQLTGQINTAGLLIRVDGATIRSFRKMELLESEEEKENNSPIHIANDDNYDDTDLFCEAVEEEDYNLCSGCNENPFAQLVQPWGHMICTNCVKKTNCQLCLCQKSNNITIDLDDFEWYFHVFQYFNLNGAPETFFQLVSFGQFL